MEGIICYRDGQAYVEHDLVEIKDGWGKPCKAMKLTDEEAKARISCEYGFEYNSIIIKGVCWYEATDWNYFRFSIRGWEYEAKDFGCLEVVK